jgi:hypothetical protein
MSFGALILLKSDGPNSAWEPIDGSHRCAVTEIRVEQHLDKQTSFAIRFQEDFEDQQALEAAQAQFAKSTGVAICVPNGPETVETPHPELVCLVHGQIENVEFDVCVGGSGSWFEIRGQDIRTRMNRGSRFLSLEGSSSEVIARLVAECEPDETDIGPEIKNYFGREIRYSLRGSALDATYDLARKSGYGFWLGHDVDTRSGYAIKSTVYVKSSPDRHDQATPPASFDGLDLFAADAEAQLRILGDERQCETVVNFKSIVDNEAVNAASSYAQDVDTGEQSGLEDVTSPDAGLNPQESVVTVGGESGHDAAQPRGVVVGSLGDPDLAKWRAYAAAIEASWYVRAEALTTAHMLAQVLQPHAIVEVVGGGCGIAGRYQVSDVTHVINAAEHWMKLELRSNSRNTQSTPDVRV